MVNCVGLAVDAALIQPGPLAKLPNDLHRWCYNLCVAKNK